MQVPGLSDIKRAHQRIEPYVTKTPVLTSAAIDKIAGANLFFKCENFQKTGSFKIRGASNAIFSFLPEEREKGFATHSSGNHAQAVAYASKLAGVKAYIVMPKNAAQVKKNAVKAYGGEVILCDPNEKSRIATCDEVLKKTGATFISPFEDPRIIAGQASAYLEFITEVEDPDFVLTPIGGGGLASGIALSVKLLTAQTKVILGEPEEVNDMFLSFQQGKIVPNTSTNTIADGLKVTVGKLNFEILRDLIDDVVTVSEQEIIDAMRLIWERMKIIIEPSSAVPFAVVLKEKKKFKNKKVGIILTGGNVDIGNLPFDR